MSQFFFCRLREEDLKNYLLKFSLEDSLVKKENKTVTGAPKMTC